ncbi:MAG: type II toxin-antitoxin system prevent-host-death family antitoxin [SAR324 cluster bacterium]|nr:type II toxin-antitoxin system prevent-host-death family antitoxin [SAR324 cluster bacterium]
MIRANISEVKNRLSHYLRLVRGGEQVEILDRNTPLARIIHVSQANSENSNTPWISEVERLGIVTPPKVEGYSTEFLSGQKLISGKGNRKKGVLETLLKERRDGR